MVLMVSQKGGKEYVADALVTTYLSRGYTIDGEEQETAPDPGADQEAMNYPPADPDEGKQEDGADPDEVTDPLDDTVPEVYVCPVCGKEYKTASGYQDHMKSKHPEI